MSTSATAGGAAFAASAERARARFTKNLRVESRYEEEEVNPLAQKSRKVEESAWPESVECYLGPTNSGKTWRSLQFMAEKGAGCYAGPLRSLACEVRLDLIDRCNKIEHWRGVPPIIGVYTGEEKINAEDASILCCTAEVCPTQGQILVLDEVHWCADRQRGAAWTKLLLAARDGRFRHVRICGPSQAAHLIRTIFLSRKALENRCFIQCRRRSKLHFMGAVQTNKKKNQLAQFLVKTCIEEQRRLAIIAFSRNAVLSLAASAQRAGVRASALFGKLPPEARRSQLEAVRRGDFDVIVTTDVIGHGLNLPFDDVLFTETRKRDMSGESPTPQLRSLYLWEAAQIAGRAGRDERSGRAWVLQSSDTELIHSAVNLANGDDHLLSDHYHSSEDDLSATSSHQAEKKFISNSILHSTFTVEHCVLAPQLDELADLCPNNIASLHMLPKAVQQWARQLNQRPELPEWLRGADIAELCERLTLLLGQELVPEDVTQALTLDQYWQLALLPVGRSNFQELATAAALTKSVRAPKALDSLAAESLEDEIQRLGDIIIASRRFPCLIDASWDIKETEIEASNNEDADDELLQARRLAAAEELYLKGSKRIGNHIQQCIDFAALCKVCQQPKQDNTKPSDQMCRNCFLAQQREKQRNKSQELLSNTPPPTSPAPPKHLLQQDRRQSSKEAHPYTPVQHNGRDPRDKYSRRAYSRDARYTSPAHLYEPSPAGSAPGTGRSFRGRSSRGRGRGRQRDS